MSEALLLLGGNRGEVEQTFEQAIALLEERVGVVLAKSRKHWTEPWGFTDEQLFLNQALLVRTELEPAVLMHTCLHIERSLGRERHTPSDGPRVYGPRSIDIDVLLIGERVVQEPGLEVPHPRLHERAFALAPTADVVPQWIHPVLGLSVLSLLHDVQQRDR